MRVNRKPEETFRIHLEYGKITELSRKNRFVSPVEQLWVYFIQAIELQSPPSEIPFDEGC